MDSSLEKNLIIDERQNKMGKNLQNEVEYYYDSHPTPEDLMGEISIHADLVRYLMLVLAWLFRGQRCAIYENLNFYQTPNPREYPLAPDIAVIKGVDYRHLRSWKVGKTGPAPHVVFEIASEETWKKDVEEKPLRYALMGVEEYFFYDPDDAPHWRHPRRRLLGWQFNKVTGAITEMVPDQEGRLWSQHLDSFLVPDGISLRLYDSNHQLRLTEAEALAQERNTLAQERDALAQKLRSLGVNPDEI
jgi:Uma2 family endonuclease